MPVFAAVSQATHEFGSCFKHASKTASETISQSYSYQTQTQIQSVLVFRQLQKKLQTQKKKILTLSGCPSFTDSDVNKNSSSPNPDMIHLKGMKEKI